MSADLGQLLEAASFAARAHQWQKRKDGKTPYAAHPFRVCMIVRHVFGFDDPEMLVAALLHDTIEDTTTDCDDIIEHFGPKVAEWVRALTKDKRLPENEREKTYAEALASAVWQVQVLKLADLYDNLSDVKQLDPAKRVMSIERYRFYIDHLGAKLDRRAEAAFKVVCDLLETKKKET